MNPSTTNGAQVIMNLTDAAFAASVPGYDIIKTAWSAIFPEADPPFNSTQIAQLQALLEEVLQNFSYQQYLNDLNGLTIEVNQYVYNPEPSNVPNMLSASDVLLSNLESCGYGSASVLINASSLAILILKFELDITPVPNQRGAMDNIVAAAINALSTLVDFESAYCNASGFENMVTFKAYTNQGIGAMPSDALQAFGIDYVKQVQNLMQIVKDYDDPAKPRFNEIVNPPYVMSFVPYNSQTTPLFWNSEIGSGGGYFTSIGFFKSINNSGFFPLGDIMTMQNAYPSATPPTLIPYISSGAVQLVQATGSGYIYDDGGSGNADSYSAWGVGADGCTQIGTFSGTGTTSSLNSIPNTAGYNAPDLTQCQLVNNNYIISVGLSGEAWDNATTAHEDCTVYAHPQFGNYGVYNLFRSHSQPDPDTVPGLSGYALAGHPPLT